MADKLSAQSSEFTASPASHNDARTLNTILGVVEGIQRKLESLEDRGARDRPGMTELYDSCPRNSYFESLGFTFNLVANIRKPGTLQ